MYEDSSVGLLLVLAEDSTITAAATKSKLSNISIVVSNFVFLSINRKRLFKVICAKRRLLNPTRSGEVAILVFISALYTGVLSLLLQTMPVQLCAHAIGS